MLPAGVAPLQRAGSARQQRGPSVEEVRALLTTLRDRLKATKESRSAFSVAPAELAQVLSALRARPPDPAALGPALECLILCVQTSVDGASAAAAAACAAGGVLEALFRIRDADGDRLRPWRCAVGFVYQGSEAEAKRLCDSGWFEEALRVLMEGPDELKRALRTILTKIVAECLKKHEGARNLVPRTGTVEARTAGGRVAHPPHAACTPSRAPHTRSTTQPTPPGPAGAGVRSSVRQGPFHVRQSR